MLILAALVASTAAARPTPLPLDQWTPRAHVWLARGMVAEAGWLAERDHVAIAYVLARRWNARVRRYPRIRFVDIIRAYCAGLEPGLHSPTRRQRWLRSLSFDFAQPEAWPKKASWRRHKPLWRAALQRSHDWSRGKFRDPCRGLAWHWGGYIDPARGKMVPVACGDTRNTFYGLDNGQGGGDHEDGKEDGEDDGGGRDERDQVAEAQWAERRSG